MISGDGARSLVPHRTAERALAAIEPRTWPKRPLRVPADAFVSLDTPHVGERSRFRLPPPAPPPRTANDNEAPPRTGRERLRRVVREAIFLVLLAVTIAAAFYSGRQNGSQNVIVVPGPLSFYAAVT